MSDPGLFGEMPHRAGMGGHHSASADTHTWLTPPEIIDALGPFDLDPCAAPHPRPWPTAALHWTREHGSLRREWHGRVWLNPPYGADVGRWLRRMDQHGRGTALIFARTETEAFFDEVWCAKNVSAILFLRGRLFFHHPDGKRAAHNCGAPSVLIAYGALDGRRLAASGIPGALVEAWKWQGRPS